MRTPTPPRLLYGLLIVCVSLYLYFFVRVLWRVGDEGIFLNGAAMVARGHVPYRDFFENVGPASFYWLGAFFWLFGTSLIVARGIALATFVAMSVLILWMTRRVHTGPFQLLPALLYVVAGFTVWPVTNHHWDSNLFALSCLAVAMKWQDDGRGWHLVLAGTLAGVTSCFLQQKGLLMVIAILTIVAAVTRQNRRSGVFRSFALVVAGYSAVLMAVVLLFFVTGSLPQLVDDTVIWPLVNYTDLNTVPYGYGLFQWLRELSWKPALEPFLPMPMFILLTGLFLVPYTVIVGLPILCVVIAVLPLIRREAVPLFARMSLPYWSGGLALWISELHRRDIVHLIYGAPVLLILLFVGWSTWCDHKKRLRQVTLGVLTASILALGAFQVLIALSARHKLETRRGNIYAFREDGALRFLNDELRPREAVFVYPYYSMYYFLADVVNPTKFSILLYGFNTDAQFESVINDLERQQVTWVLWDSAVYGSRMTTWFPRYRSPGDTTTRLEQYLGREYDVVRVENGFRILRRRERDSGGRLSRLHVSGEVAGLRLGGGELPDQRILSLSPFVVRGDDSEHSVDASDSATTTVRPSVARTSSGGLN